MEEYIINLEKIFVNRKWVQNSRKKSISDYKSKEYKDCKKLAFSAYKSSIYQARMYAIFLFGFLSDDIFIRR